MNSESASLTTKRFILYCTLGAAFVSLLPFLLGLIKASLGTETYLGHQYNTDDHMVYAAWMRQAMDGRVLFDNRFTTDPQPGQTFHLYFLVLGWLAKLVGIDWAAALSKAFFSGLFVVLLGRLFERVRANDYGTKIGVALVTLGGGVGFAVWHTFGMNIVKPSPLAGLMQGRLPIDVWQPEAFVFPSMLTNSLFMVSLCLILGIALCVVDSKTSSKPVPLGALLFAVLANVHTYDVALIGLSLGALLVASIVNKEITRAWLLRCLSMAAGVVPPALWFYHVLTVDPVFQARAATETFSPAFRQVFFGLFPLIVLALVHLVFGKERLKRHAVAAGALAVFILALFFAQNRGEARFWLSWPVFALVYAAAVLCVSLIPSRSTLERLAWSFAVVGLVAMYMPTLFQRKLTMGLSVSWAILAGLAFTDLLGTKIDRYKRNLFTIAVLALLSASSLLWFQRELLFIKMDVSRTTLHPVFMPHNVTAILEYLNKNRRERTVVLAMPGIWSPIEPDRFASPYLPDLNPIVSGLTGCYTYAGHWSETPNYNQRRAELNRFFTAAESNEQAEALLESTQADYILAPVPGSFTEIPLRDMRIYGKAVVKGPQFILFRVGR